VALRLASECTGRAVGVAWPPTGGAGGFKGHVPGALAQKGRLFFLSALARNTFLFLLAEEARQHSLHICEETSV
jgi:hypothetical protein